MPDRDCTLACVRGGSKFALVVDGKVFQIANQDLEDLKTHAGHNVTVTASSKVRRLLYRRSRCRSTKSEVRSQKYEARRVRRLSDF
jgi:hypothetical protein